jgi:hypothetical protein
VNGVTLSDAAEAQTFDTVAYTYFGDGTNLNSPTKVAVTQGVFSTSVVTPLVTTSGSLILQNSADSQMSFQINSVTKWAIANAAGGFAFFPGGAFDIGTVGAPVAHVFTPITDSGSGSLVLKAANTTFLTGTGANTVLAGTLVGPASFDLANTVSTTVNFAGAASTALNIGHASAAAAFAGGITVPTGKTYAGAGNISTTGSAKWGTGEANFGTITKRKTADESVTSSTTLQDDDHLTFAIAANEEWVADFWIDGGSALSTTGMKIAINAPAGATINAVASIIGNATTAVSISKRTTSIATAIDFTTALTTNMGDGDISLKLWCLNGANAGNITLQWAQSTSNATSLIFRKGSHMNAAIRMA